jgi:probable HAF family extracellular repeat protein
MGGPQALCRFPTRRLVTVSIVVLVAWPAVEILAAGFEGLGDLSGGTFESAAYGVSADGSVVIGGADSTSGDEAFRWTQAGGMVGLGDLPGGAFGSRAYGVSADGSVVVGYRCPLHSTLGRASEERYAQSHNRPPGICP